MILLMKLILAHLLGDFVLQPDRWVHARKLKKASSPELYYHGLVHLLLILLLTWNISFIIPALVIAAGHVGIDLLKVKLQKEHNHRRWFFADQGLHFLLIIAVVWLFTKPGISWTDWPLHQLWIIATGIVFLLQPSSVIIKLILSKWAPATEIKTDKIETPSLIHAGKMIGYLERILVFIFILNDQWGAIGFLVTAKSVFRFSDLKLGQDRKLTEYILIGTLLSFGIAIVAGMVTGILITQAQLLDVQPVDYIP